MARKTDSVNGRVSQQRHAVVKAASFLMVGNPTRKEENGEVTYEANKKDASAAAVGRVLGLPERTTRRLLKNAREQKGRILDGEEGAWQLVAEKANWTKVYPELAKELREWIERSMFVRPSPIIGDEVCLRDDNGKIIRDENGKAKKVRKYILDVTYRELHNALLKPKEEGGLDSVWDTDGRLIVSQWALQNYIPHHIKRSSNRYKQMCMCDKCVIMDEIHAAYHQYQNQHLRRLKAAAAAARGADKRAKEDVATKYEEAICVDGKPRHEYWKDAVRSIQCPNVGDTGFPHWKCVLGRCKDCPEYFIPEAEKDCTDRISYNDFIPLTKCTEHGWLPRRSKACPVCSEMTEEEINGHNVVGDPDLGPMKVAVRRVACACKGCSDRLERPWVMDVNLHPSDQPRYKGHCTECDLWPIFGGLNDWRIVSLVPKQINNDTALDDAREEALCLLGRRLATRIRKGHYGAVFVDDDEDYDYYPVEWLDDPYEVEEDGKISDHTCIVRMSTVLAADVNMLLVSEDNPILSNIPRRYKKDAEDKGARLIPDADHNSIMMESKLREEMDVERPDEEELLSSPVDCWFPHEVQPIYK